METFDYEYRVRYGDTDRMGITYYANYLVWFESARTEYFRALGLPYTECEKKGIFLPVVESFVKYHSPSTYDDIVVIRTSVSEVRKGSLRFQYCAFNQADNRKICTGHTVHVFVDKKMNPVRIPEEVESLVTPFTLI